jgi:hypothetical protein
MAVEMRLNLPLGFNNKTQALRISHARGNSAQCKRACIPQGIEQTGPRPQLGQTCGGPGKVIELFFTGMSKLRPRIGIAGKPCLRLIQGLGAHLTNMIHAHQPRAMPPLWFT